MKSPFDILQISPSATQVEIKAAYRRLVKQYHPDVNNQPNAASIFHEIQQAFESVKRHQPRPQWTAPRRRAPPTGAMKFYEFVKSQTTVTIVAGVDKIPAHSIVYLMWKDKEYRVNFNEERTVPFTLKLIQPPILLRMIKDYDMANPPPGIF